MSNRQQPVKNYAGISITPNPHILMSASNDMGYYHAYTSYIYIRSETGGVRGILDAEDRTFRENDKERVGLVFDDPYAQGLPLSEEISALVSNNTAIREVRQRIRDDRSILLRKYNGVSGLVFPVHFPSASIVL